MSQQKIEDVGRDQLTFDIASRTWGRHSPRLRSNSASRLPDTFRAGSSRIRAVSAPRSAKPGTLGVKVAVSPFKAATKSTETLYLRERNLVLQFAEGSEFQKTLTRLRAIEEISKKRFVSVELTNFVQTPESWKKNPVWLWVLRILALMILCITLGVLMLIIPFGDPYAGIRQSLGYATWTQLLAGTCATNAVIVQALEVMKIPLAAWKYWVVGLIAATASTSLLLLIGLFADFFPVPYWPVIGGSICVPIGLAVAVAFQPRAVLKDPVIRKKLPWITIMVLCNVGSGFVFAFYVALFASVEGNLQTAVAPLLAVVKIAVKYNAMSIAKRLDNPDFRHGTGLFPDVCGVCVSGIIFINTNSISTFLVLLAIDTAINLKHCLQILSVVMKSQKEKHQRLVRQLCVTRHDPKVFAAAMQEIKTPTLNPQLVELCGDFFFSEVIESLVPLINGFTAWIVYYLPNCNRRWVYYMWQNNEEEFNQGMRYILLDCSVQLALFFVLARYMYFKAQIPIFHVGMVLADKHKAAATWMICGLALFYLLIFIEHSGVDTRFSFDWLGGNFNASMIDRKMKPCE